MYGDDRHKEALLFIYLFGLVILDNLGLVLNSWAGSLSRERKPVLLAKHLIHAGENGTGNPYFKF